jgi:hypothetical protein
VCSVVLGMLVQDGGSLRRRPTPAFNGAPAA